MCFFLCLEERKNVQKTSRQRAKPEKNHFFGLEVPGAFYSPGMAYKVTALQGPLPSSGLRSG